MIGVERMQSFRSRVVGLGLGMIGAMGCGGPAAPKPASCIPVESPVRSNECVQFMGYPIYSRHSSAKYRDMSLVADKMSMTEYSSNMFIKLKEDTSFQIGKDRFTFAAGSELYLHEDCKTIGEGRLAANTRRFKIRGNDILLAKLVFTKDGNLIGGNLAEDAKIRIGGQDFTIFKGDPIIFYEDGQVRRIRSVLTDDVRLNAANLPIMVKGTGIVIDFYMWDGAILSIEPEHHYPRGF